MQSRERFDRIVLDGEPGRGMPGYGNAPRIADQIDSLFRCCRPALDRTRGET